MTNHVELRDGQAPDRTAHDLANRVMKEKLEEELADEDDEEEVNDGD